MTVAHTPTRLDAWRGFDGQTWRTNVDVADLVRRNHRPYTGDETFLAGSPQRTTDLWLTVREMFAQERGRGIYDADPDTPATITSHAPGYVDRDRELIATAGVVTF
jgi:formate C-acetyltransferase